MFDTAGLRRRAKVEDKLEKLAGADALRAAKFAEVVVLLLDATIPFEKQDLTLADLVEREGRALVIGLNKWDLIEAKEHEALRICARRRRASCRRSRARRSCRSPGATGAGIDKLMEAIVAAHVVWNKRISTARLNRWLAAAIEVDPAARGRGTAHQDPLHDATARAPALFHYFRQSARGLARELRALSRQRAAPGLRSAGRPDPHFEEDHRKSILG